MQGVVVLANLYQFTELALLFAKFHQAKVYFCENVWWFE